jgi:prepilin-type N-terminal cleavage/methylation domain-containing protein
MSRPTPRGFTIIEIVLVLAIAGLIFLVVFLAIGTAQRGARDHDRKHAASEFTAAMIKYLADHQNQLPNSQIELNTMVGNYLGGYADPSLGTPYVADFDPGTAAHDWDPPLGHIGFARGHLCGYDIGLSTILGDPPAYWLPNLRFAVLVHLESGNAPYCITGHT